MGDSDLAEKLNNLKNEITAAREKAGTDDNETCLKDQGKSAGASSVNLAGIKTRRTLKGHFGKVYSMHWAGTDQEEKLVSASQDGKLIIWNAQTTNKTQAVPLRSSWVMTCAYEKTQNGLVACGGLDNLCSIYSINEENPHGKATKELAHHDGYLSCCRFLSEKKMITSSGDSTCIVWDVESTNPQLICQKHTSDVMSVTVSPDNPNVFVSGSCDATCIQWDMRANTQFEAIQAHYPGHESDINSVCFFPDSKCFGTGSDDSSCKIFDTRSYNDIAHFGADTILCGVTSVGFSFSGRVLFGGYDDYNVHMWDTLGVDTSTKHLFHENRVSCLGVEDKGRALCTGSWDTLLKIIA